MYKTVEKLEILRIFYKTLLDSGIYLYIQYETEGLFHRHDNLQIH
jgi:hypothetical protein